MARARPFPFCNLQSALRNPTPLLLLTASLPSATLGQWRPEERVVIRDFGDVRAVAMSSTLLYGVTRGGVIVHDFRSGRWLPPVTELDGYPLGAEPLVALADPVDESLWVGTTDGLVQYLPTLQEVRRVPTGAVHGLFLDRDDPFGGTYLATADGWRQLPRGALIPVPVTRLPPPERRVAPLDVDDVLRAHPAADAARSLALTDRQLRRFRFTAVAEEPFRGHFFFGTNGAGIVRYDPLTVEFERLPFGLVADRVGALAAVDGTVWVGAEGGGERAGTVRLDGDFRQLDAWESGGRLGGVRFRDVRALAPWADAVWAATDAGLVRADDPGGRLPRELAELNAYALASAPGGGGLWVGTDRGVALVRMDAGGEPVLAATIPTLGPVTSLAVAGDSVWIGGPGGLGVIAGAARRVMEPAAARRVLGLAAGVGAVAAGEGYVVVAGEATVSWRDPRGAWTEAPSLPELREVTTVVVDGGGAWAAGRAGVIRVRFSDGSVRRVLDDRDLPGRVSHMAVGDGYLWLGTEGGVVRFRRDILLP